MAAEGAEGLDSRAGVRVALGAAGADARERLRARLGDLVGVELVGTAGGGREALALLRASHPDVALLHVDLPGPDDLSLTRVVVADPHLTGTSVLVAAADELDPRVDAALRAGATGVVRDDLDAATLRRTVRLAADGRAPLDPRTAARLVAAVAADPPRVRGTARLQRLTPHEREVLALVAAGARDDEAAARLRLSLATVRTHVARALAKLGARDRAQLVVLAYETGLVGPGGTPTGVPLDDPDVGGVVP